MYDKPKQATVVIRILLLCVVSLSEIYGGSKWWLVMAICEICPHVIGKTQPQRHGMQRQWKVLAWLDAQNIWDDIKFKCHLVCLNKSGPVLLHLWLRWRLGEKWRQIYNTVNSRSYYLQVASSSLNPASVGGFLLCCRLLCAAQLKSTAPLVSAYLKYPLVPKNSHGKWLRTTIFWVIIST